MVKPTQTFREVAENDQSYFIVAIAIFVATSFFFINITSDQPDSSLEISEFGYVWDVMYQAESFTKSVVWNAISVVLIFYLGLKFGGSNSFKKVFSVLAYAMVPVLVGGIALHIFFMHPFMLESITGMDKESEEFLGLFWVLYFASIPFAIWSFLLSIHAIKIVNRFGNAKAFGVLMISVAAVFFASWAVTLVL